MTPDLRFIFNQFSAQGIFREGMPYGSGHINDTFKIITKGSGINEYILQRINHYVFKDIPGLQHNIEYVTSHIRSKLEKIPGANPDRQTLTLINTRKGKTYFFHPETGYWRCYIFISNHKSYNRVSHASQAFEAGHTFGQFEKWLSDLDPALLTETIPGFHDMQLRLRQFSEALQSDSVNRAKDIPEEIAFVHSHGQDMTRIQRLGSEGKIPLRITHNDTKFNNVLLDEYDHGLCVIDLDTVMPGYIHYDFGDAIRTSANGADEDEQDLKKVTFRIDFFEAFAKGFLRETVAFLSEEEVRHLAFSAQVMTFIIGIRFLTDHLNGDIYFKIHRPNHNLQRARVQFQLIREMEKKRDRMEEIIHETSAG
ncbi:MAG: aminoglycoside phosphotransferase family protein [Chlorobi bacterium]|nr:aminoglycoside phosphotransferase family protein [Chlorobiota bacterium]